MPSCAILECKNKSEINNLSKGGITYHRFPNNPIIKEKWIMVTGRQNWFPSKNSTICSAHFQNDNFVIKKSGNRYLTDTAVPTQKILLFHVQNQLCESPIISTSNLKHRLEADDKLSEEDETPTNLSSSILNTSTPHKRVFKAIIRDRENVIKRQRLQIKRTQAQNRRLKKKLYNLENVLKSLQETLENVLKSLQETCHVHSEDINNLQNSNVKLEEF